MDAKNLIKKMLEYDQEKRISAEEALQDKWIQNNTFTNPIAGSALKNL